MPQSSHFQLRASIDGSEVAGESLTMYGSSFSFKVHPVNTNNTQADINESIKLTHNGTNYAIALRHKHEESPTPPDPQPSLYKWSYVDDLRVSYDHPSDSDPDPVDPSIAKTFQYGYMFIESGVYNNHPESIYIGFVFTTQSVAENSLRDRCYDHSIRMDETADKICRFKMYYKPYVIDPDTQEPIIPIDDGTPASNRSRLPCKVECVAPSWFIDPYIVYRIRVTTSSETPEEIDEDFTDWDEFLARWNEVRVDTENYSDAKFYGYVYSGIQRNYSIDEMRGPDTITIQEVPQLIDGTLTLTGASPLHVYAGQLEMRNPDNR